MNTKLTLRLDDKLIAKAKRHARRTGKSLSQIVAEYFHLLGHGATGAEELTPTVSRLKGALRGSGVDVQDYRDYLERKHR